MHQIQTITALFDNVMLREYHATDFNNPNEAVDFKKPVCSALADLRDSGQTDGIDTELFYNRDEETGNSENRYPLIQYKSINGKAAITGISEGAVALQQLLQLLSEEKNRHLNKRFLFSKQNPVDLYECRINQHTHHLKLLSTKKQYIIKNWLPLDTHRYKAWMASGELKMLVDILDECLPRQISKMLGGLGYHHSLPFIAHTTSILSTGREIPVYHDKKVPFDCIIFCNLDLPAGIGIGQSPGIGYGTIIPINSKKHI